MSGPQLALDTVGYHDLPALVEEVRQLRQALAAVEEVAADFAGQPSLTWGGPFIAGEILAAVTPTPQETCEHGWIAAHTYEDENGAECACPGPDGPVTPTPEAATDGDEKLTQLKLTQMRAAVVQCCWAGREAYPDPCPWHGTKGQQS